MFNQSTKVKSTKRSFILSLLSLIVCVAMLLGTTYAWFTDSVTSGKNKIVAGNLDVDLVMDKSENGTYVSIANENGAIFGGESSLYAQNKSSDTLWEPGKTQIVYLGVKNAGSLALKYNVVLNVKDNGLASALEYAIIDGATAATLKPLASKWTDITGYTGVQTGNVAAGTFTAAEGGVLDEIAKGTKDETDYFALAVHMKEEAGNEYKEKSVEIDVTIYATQMTAESDSFDNQYDKTATLSIPFEPITGDVTSDIKIENKGPVKEATVAADTVNDVFDDMKDSTADDNTLTLNLNVEEKGSDENSIDFDINLTAVMKSTKNGVTTTKEKKLENLDEFVEIKLNVGANRLNLVAKHNGQAMTKVANKAAIASVAANTYGYFSYDEATGDTVIWLKSFSPISFLFEKYKTDAELLEENPKYTCRIANKGYERLFYETNELESAFSEAKSGDTIKLIADYETKNALKAVNRADDSEITLDLNGKKCTVSSFETRRGVFNIIDTSEDKNGEIIGTVSVFENISHSETNKPVITLNVYAGHIEKIATGGGKSHKNVNIYGGTIDFVNLPGSDAGFADNLNVYGGSIAKILISNDVDEVPNFVFPVKFEELQEEKIEYYMSLFGNRSTAEMFAATARMYRVTE